MLFVYLQFDAAIFFFAIQLNYAKGRLYPVTYTYSDNTSHIKIQLQCYIIYIKEFS